MAAKKYIEYGWLDNVTLRQALEVLSRGCCLNFQFKGKDYCVDDFGQTIVDPALYEGEYEGVPYPSCHRHYPESGKAQSLEEFRKLRFLDGKTFEEVFDELKVFD